MNIAVIPNIKKDIGLAVTQRLTAYLRGKAQIYMEKGFEKSGINACYCPDVYENADAVIVLGGDGTILKSAESCARRNIPILGINLGRVGFMAEIEQDGIPEAVDRLLAGDYRIQKRMMMKTEIIRDGQVQGCFHALNDMVITRTAETKLMGMRLFSGGEQVSEYVADGLILATPTGSTGYNLSAGGPVVNPKMTLFTATPICAHMLSARPAVLPAEDPITIRLSSTFAVNEAVVTVDGDVCGYIKSGDEISVTKSEYETSLIKMGKQSFYDVLIHKLL